MSFRIASSYGGRLLSLCAKGTRNVPPQVLLSKRTLVSDIRGIYPPIVTPFDKDEDISYSNLAKNIKAWNSIGFRGYVVQGSNGEYVSLTPRERVEMVSKVKEMADPEKLIIAGAGCEGTAATISMCREMSSAGADVVLVVTPSYYKNNMTSEALTQHFTRVADDCPVPVILYSVPANTGIDLDAATVTRLSIHENIIGLKDSGGDVSKIGKIVHETKNNNFQVLAGSASFLYPAVTIGCVGGVLALANVLGSQCVDLYNKALAGDHENSRDLQHRLITPNLAVTKMFGVPGLKQTLDWFGYYGGPVRGPLLPLSTTQQQQLKAVFEPFL